MSASDQVRAMLDQLMGTARDGKSNKSVKFYDLEVCKTFLMGCCPSEVLLGTRADVGTCKKMHDLALKADYEMAQKNKDYFYDFEAYTHLRNFVADIDRRIDVAKDKLAEQQAEVSAEVQNKAEAVHDLNEKIGKLVVEAEKLGSEGKVDEAKEILKQVEKLKEGKRTAEEAYRNSMPTSTYQQQKLRVCEVCSAYLGLHDNDCRLADHFGGKLHLGFLSLREECDKLEKQVAGRKEAYDAAIRLEREESRLRRSDFSSRRRSPSPRRQRSRSRERGDHRRRRSRSPRDDRQRRSHRRSRSRERVSSRRHRDRSHSPDSRRSSHHNRSSRRRSRSRS